MRASGFLLAAAAALPAHAADVSQKPAIAPPAAWVIPAKLPADTAKPDEAAVRVLLSDQQVRLTKEGEDIYTESVLRVQTPQGLQLLGSIALPWKPDTSTLTVHKLRILRGPQVIDLLKDGPGFTVLRRENKLEYATLDGVLTAVIQPEGLQVGDVVDIASTISARDPVLAGHPEVGLGGWANVPVAHVSSRALWDDALPIRWRATEGTPAVRQVRHGGTTEISLAADALAPVLYPKDAPQRFRLPRLVETTSYASWAELSALFAPLYARAATIAPGFPLAAEVAKIAASSADPSTRAEAALALAQDRVRYVALAMGDGGLMPVAADLTWQRRFGDCKGKTALLLAMLHALGIEAEPAIVSSGFGDGLDERLPMAGLFDHVLVRATIAGKVYWLDGTRVGDRRLVDVVVPPFRWALPVRARGATLERLVQQPATRPFTTLDIRIDATKGLAQPAPFHADTVLRGDVATQLKLNLANLTPEQRDQQLRDFWTGRYDFLTVKAATAQWDDATGEERLSVDGTATMDWSSNSYEADGMGVGWTADFTRPDGPHRDAPFAVGFPAYERTTETILLPNAGKGFAIDTPDVDRTVAGIEYHRKARLQGATYRVELTSRTVAPEFPASEAAKDQTDLRALAKQRVFLNKTKDYAWTEEERNAVLASNPKTAAEYLDRAAAHFQRREFHEAITDYSEYLRQHPKDPLIFAWRGKAHLALSEFDDAQADFTRALTLDPKNDLARLALAQMALMRGRPLDALNQADQVIATASSEAAVNEALGARITANTMLGRLDSVTADRARLAKHGNPVQLALSALQAGDTATALATLQPVLAGDPSNVEALLLRGSTYAAMSKDDLARADYARAVMLDPKAGGHMGLASLALRRNRFADALREIGAELAVNPQNREAQTLRAITMTQQNGAAGSTEARAAFAKQGSLTDQAMVALEARDFPGAVRLATGALSADPSDVRARSVRAEAYAKLERRDEALADTAAILKDRPDLIDIYLLRANIFRQIGDRARSLAEAEAAATANPKSDYAHLVAGAALGSYGKTDDARREFDRAIAIKPTVSAYLTRANYRSPDDHDGQQADAEAALRLDPNDPSARSMKVRTAIMRHDYPTARNNADTYLRDQPDDPAMLNSRGIALVGLAHPELAHADFLAARAAAHDAPTLNNLCWSKAIAGLALEEALVDCDAALKMEPDLSATLDSRALVLLRLGRYAEAISAYSAYLKRVPKGTSSLYGRGVAELKLGHGKEGEADMAAAIAEQPTIAKEFAGYGVTA